MNANKYNRHQVAIDIQDAGNLRALAREFVKVTRRRSARFKKGSPAMKRVLKTIRALVSVARDQVDGKITLTHWRHQLVDVADLAEAEAYANQMALQFGGRVAFAGKAPKPRKRSTLISCEAPSEYKLEQRAIEYARWLADRDSIKLPVNGKEQVIWGSVTSLTRKSSAGRAIRERRIKAVYFGDVQVPIPHWDWQPVCLAEPDDARPPVRESVPVAA